MQDVTSKEILVNYSFPLTLLILYFVLKEIYTGSLFFIFTG